MPRRQLLPIAFAVLAALCAPSACARTLIFSGYTWEVRTGTGGPGPNHWNAANARVDAAGALHLQIRQVNGVWQCAEVFLDQRLGFGTYTFEVTGPIDRLDRNVVLGLFDYPTPDVGPDGTNEIDIEFSRWGNAANPIGNYTVWPAVAGLSPASHTFDFTLSNTRTTQRFAWSSTGIGFTSFRGFTTAGTGYAHWTYQPSNPARHVPQNALPVHLNLWLFDGHAPSDGQPVEIVINRFTFTPG